MMQAEEHTRGPSPDKVAVMMTYLCVCLCVPTCSLSLAVTNVTCKQNHSVSFYGLLYFSETVALSLPVDSTANLTTGLLATAGRTKLVVLVPWWLLRTEALLGKPFINVI